jgi:hypothetical protein
MCSTLAPGYLLCENLAKLQRSVGLAVAERDIKHGFEIETHRHQLAQRQRAHAALAHVVVDQIFPGRLHALHFKSFHSHI